MHQESIICLFPYVYLVERPFFLGELSRAYIPCGNPCLTRSTLPLPVDFGGATLLMCQSVMIQWLVMWVKQYHKPLGTGKHTTKQKMVNLAGWFMALFYPRENV